jgi:F0F1-type ATP synthase membrane subunit b/b'
MENILIALQSLPLELIVVVLLGTLVALLFILIGVGLRNSLQIERITYPAYEYITKKARADAEKIIAKAMDDAQKLKVEAEIEGIKRLAKENLEIESIEEKYKETLQKTAEESEALFRKYRDQIKTNLDTLKERSEEQIKKYLPIIEEESKESHRQIETALTSLKQKISGTEDKYEQFIDSLQDVLRRQFEKNTAIIKEETEKLPGTFGKRLEDAAEEGRRILNDKIHKEFENARRDIEKYRVQYTEFLDEHIASLVEDTTTLVLQKKLTTEEHTELAIKALGEAKKAGIFEKK